MTITINETIKTNNTRRRNNVKRYRLQLHMTQQQLADLAGVSRGTIKNIERGVLPRELTRQRIYDALRDAGAVRNRRRSEKPVRMGDIF